MGRNNIRQDLQDYLDKGAFGYFAAGEKNLFYPANPCPIQDKKGGKNYGY